MGEIAAGSEDDHSEGLGSAGGEGFDFFVKHSRAPFEGKRDWGATLKDDENKASRFS
jgi:hypothetical protein